MIRKCCIFLLFLGSIFANEEDLHLKRLIAFWKDEQYQILKPQIETFLTEFPKSTHQDTAKTMLAHLHMMDSAFDPAIQIFESIQALRANPNAYVLYLEALFQNKMHEKSLIKIQDVIEDKHYFSKNQQLLHLKTQSQLQHIISQKPTQKKHLLKELEKELDSINDEKYLISTLRAKLYISQTLENTKKSIQVAKELAFHADEKHEYLFIEAIETAKIDPNLSILKLKKIAKSKHPFQEKALYNLLVLLFNEKKYDDILEMKQFSKCFAKENLPLFELYLAHSYLELKVYTKAKELYKQTLHLSLSKENRKTALINLAISCFLTDDEPSFAFALNSLKKEFPDEEKLKELTFGYAKLLVQNKLFYKAQKTLEELLLFENLEKREMILLELATLYFDQKEYTKCLSKAKDYLKLAICLKKPLTNIQTGSSENTSLKASFSSSPTHKELGSDSGFPSKENLVEISNFSVNQGLLPILKMYLSCATKQAEKQAITDLEYLKTLHTKLPQNFRENLDYMLATLYFETKDFTKAMSLLTKLEKQSKKFSGDVHYLLALIEKDNLISFTHHLEMALKEKAHIDKLLEIHLHLFNAYLKLSENNITLPSTHFQKGQDLLESAAKHLICAFEKNSKAIKKENMLFLADFLYKKAKTDHDLLKKAYLIFTTLLKDFSFENDLAFDLKKKMCKLYKWQNKTNQYIESIQKLTDETNNTHEKSALYFEMAKAYLSQKRTHFAKKYFDLVIKMSPFSKYADFSKFQIVKMDIDFCQNKTDSIPLLSHLKDLQVKKCLTYEPMFLDASLLYIDLSVRFLPKNKQFEKELFLLNRMKSDFTTQEDLFSKEYHNQLKNNLKNANIYHIYMQFVDQRIAFLEAKIQNDQKREKIAIKKVLEQKDDFIKISKILEKRINTMHYD